VYCGQCGKQLSDGTNFCPRCGYSQGQGDLEVVSANDRDDAGNNPQAVWGFVCALVGLFLPLPVIDMITSVVGIVLSAAGLKKQRYKGLAIAGTVLGVLGALGAIMMLAVDPGFYEEIWGL
jgi:hypothetical protein